MPQGKDQEKNEPATPKRRQEARKQGQIAKSREIPSVLVLLSSLGVFYFSGSYMFWNLSDLMRGIFQNIGFLHVESASVYVLLLKIAQQIFKILIPLMLIIIVAGIGANLLQVGFLFTAGPLTPKLSKINPIKGMGRLFSMSSLVELIKSIIKIFVVCFAAFFIVRGELESIPSLMQFEVREILSFFAMVSLKICLYTCLTLIVLAALDYVYQRWQHEKNLRMTKQEVKDELKQREGDPSVKTRIRKIQMEMSQRRMMEAVSEADVVITNPTSMAIALQYDTERMIAPQLIAKGADFIAERIKKIAEENGIPIVEHKLLAQTLFKSVEIGEFIPADLYRAVAEILAYVYQLKDVRYNRKV